MTVATTERKQSFTTNGITVDFPFTFKATDANQIYCEYTPNGGSTADYTNFTVVLQEAGGTVTTNDVLGSGTLLVYRIVPLTQNTDYVEGGRFPADSHEAALDKLTLIDQDQQEDISRALKGPIGKDNPYTLADNLAEDELLIMQTNEVKSSGTTIDDLKNAIDNANNAAQNAENVLINLPSGQWAAGITFNSANEFMNFNGVGYTPLPTTTFPYVTQGSDPTQAPDNAFVQPFSNINSSNISTYTDLVFDSVADMIAGTTIGGADVDFSKLASIKAKVETKANNSTSGAGGAFYEILTATEYGAVPDGYGDHYVGGGTDYVAKLLIFDVYDSLQFGAIPGSVTNSTDAVTALVAAAPKGSKIRLATGLHFDNVQLSTYYRFVGDSRGNVVEGFQDSDSVIRPFTQGESCFVLVPVDGSVSGDYFPGQFAVTSIQWENLHFRGWNKTGSAVRVDETVNGGNFHIRGHLSKNCVFEQFGKSNSYMHRAYLNTWISCVFYGNETGFYNEQMGEAGGQTRFIDCQFLSNDVDIDTHNSSAFDLGIVGGSFSEGKKGIWIDARSPLSITGGTVFEAHIDGGQGYDIHVENPNVSNPNTDAYHTITGAKFISSDFMLFIEDNAAGFSDGVTMPFVIDSCEIQSDIRVDPAISKGFLLGSQNGIASGVTVSNLNRKLDARSSETWHELNDVLVPFSFNGSGGSNTVMLLRNVGDGQSLVIRRLDQGALDATDTVNMSVQVQYYDGVTWQTISNIFGEGITEEIIWANTTGATRPIRVLANDGGSGLQYSVNFKWKVV